jgi:hypothetical protein
MFVFFCLLARRPNLHLPRASVPSDAFLTGAFDDPRFDFLARFSLILRGL